MRNDCYDVHKWDDVEVEQTFYRTWILILEMYQSDGEKL